MNSDILLIIMIGLIAFNFLFSTVLDFLNDSNWNDSIPESVKDFYSKEAYVKAKNYAKEKGRIGLVSSILSFCITLLMLYLYGFGWLSHEISMQFPEMIQSDFSFQFIHTGLFFLLLFVVSDIISLPFTCYNTFVIEEKYGFNKTTVKTFVLDKIKGYILTLILGGGVLAGVLYVFNLLSEGFWLWIWVGLSGLMLFINMFYADLIVPIFNKLSPLEEGSLREKIEAYTTKVGYALKNIYIIDGSKRSTKANAFFSGLGPRKTIALYDTLIEKHGEEELVAVLAHEVGHFKKKHVLTSMILTILQLGLMCFLLEICIKNPIVSQAMGGDGVVFHLGILAFSILFSPVGTLIGMVMNMLSRKNEYEADDYAKSTYDGKALQLALKKLSVDSLSNLYPHPWYVFMHYSHPPLLKRLEALNK
ncbi:MAG: M48 family metallopeptidase [Bacteroidota bacterium]|nr:M48 family metallopeptidase [Bacteroidota bacterium]